MLKTIEHLSRLLGSNIALALLIAGGLVTGYAVLSTHHYNRGYRAHKAEVQAEIVRVNRARDQLVDALGRERREAAAANTAATADAIIATQRHCSANPSACGIETRPASSAWQTTVVKPGGCAAVCSTPASVRSALNAIK